MTTAAPHQSRSKSVEEQLYTLWSDATALVTARRSDHSVYSFGRMFPLMGVLFFLAFAAALVRRGRRRVRAEPTATIPPGGAVSAHRDVRAAGASP